jgi:hypothetical protein
MSDLRDREGPRDDDTREPATIMPWIWGAIGLVVIAIFVVWTVFTSPQAPIRHPPAAAPLTNPPSHGY